METVFGQPLAKGQVTVYVPATKGSEYLTPEQHRQYVDTVGRRLSRWFGGATITPATGLWISETTGELVPEPVVKVSSWANLTVPKGRAVKKLARWLATELAQEAVLVEVDGLPYLVRASTK